MILSDALTQACVCQYYEQAGTIDETTDEDLLSIVRHTRKRKASGK